MGESTFRGTIVGLFIGTLILLSNFQFGLQTGWVSMMSLPAALLSFGIINTFWSDLTTKENVYAQSVAVAVATGPLAFGFIGIIPAIEKLLTADEVGMPLDKWMPFVPQWKLILWSLGMAFFGVFFAVILREEFIIKQKLTFPSGKATGILIGVFHDESIKNDDDKDDIVEIIEPNVNTNTNTNATTSSQNNVSENNESDESTSLLASNFSDNEPKNETFKKNINLLLVTTAISSIYTLISYFFPMIKTLPIFGNFLSENYLLNFTPSPAYIGQGIIMGCETTSAMLVGMVIGWCILGPMAKFKGWAPGDVNDWKDGIAGWIMWVALGIMIMDSLVSLGYLTFKSIFNQLSSNENFESSEYELLNNDIRPVSTETKIKERTIPNWIPLFGLIFSVPLLVGSIRIIFGPIIPSTILILTVPLSLLLSLLGVKALGETDLNPVSGIGKLSQLLTALLMPPSKSSNGIITPQPGAILTNLICGAIAEATTQQAGDLMQDLKTGYMHDASPRAQFFAQIIGSIWGVLISAPIWRLYDKVYQIPGKVFKIPTAVIWVDCARLVNGEGLPIGVKNWAWGISIIAGMLALIKLLLKDKFDNIKWARWIPSGVAMGVGIYNTPNYTLARFLGGLLRLYCGEGISVIILSSGLVLGEGMVSVFNMALSTMGVPHW